MTTVLTAPARPPLSVIQLQRALSAVRSDPRAGVAAVIIGREPLAIVVGAHRGAGASTVALALADAAAAASGTSVLLAEDTTSPGLSAATEADLGERDTGWHIGRRNRVLIVSRAATADPVDQPDADARQVVVDVGTRVEAVMSDCPVALVCRATVPSLGLAERTLGALSDRAVLAVVGPSRWPRVVRHSAGPRVCELLDLGRVTPIPVDSRLVLVGLTSAPLPKKVLAAARSLVQLLATAAGGES